MTDISEAVHVPGRRAASLLAVLATAATLTGCGDFEQERETGVRHGEETIMVALFIDHAALKRPRRARRPPAPRFLRRRLHTGRARWSAWGTTAMAGLMVGLAADRPRLRRTLTYVLAVRPRSADAR